MGSRGPKGLPANVHLLRGNPGHKPLADLVDALQPEVEIPNCPRHLLPEARKEWKRISIELERYGLVSKLDRAALALYCQAYARWVWAEEQLQRSVWLTQAKQAEAEARGETWAGGDGYTIPTPNGHMSYSPHWVIANKAMEQVNRYMSCFGLDPASRGRVSQSAVRQRSLWADDDSKSGFDDI